jgi:hypothetical protein
LNTNMCCPAPLSPAQSRRDEPSQLSARDRLESVIREQHREGLMVQRKTRKRKHKVGIYTMVTPQVYGFPSPVTRDIRHWWIRWDSVPERTDLHTTDVFVHQSLGNPFLLRRQYMSEGWNTYVVLQDITHKGPTTAIAIGYPKEWASQSSQLSRWGADVILRLHVDICRINGKLASYPHVEPDPEYNPKEHLEMYQKKNEIRGDLALQIFREFFTSS